MQHTTLISTGRLACCIDEQDIVIVDCRFSLSDTERGRRDYLQSHIPKAVYAHLNEDLSGPVVPGKTGRHPLPGVEEFTRTLSAWGIDSSVQVVVYDDAGGAIAARLWWMLRWLGHYAVAVLDGGWPCWQATGNAVSQGKERCVSRVFEADLRSDLLVETEDVIRLVGDPAWRLIDSRVPERYRGEHEPIDPVAGHIPGAENFPFTQALDSKTGLFKSPESLRATVPKARTGGQIVCPAC